MNTLKRKCPHCNRDVIMSIDDTVLNIYCPFCKGSIQITSISNKVNDTEKKKIENRNLTNGKFQHKKAKKSEISEWWQPICFFSGFFTICRGGTTLNLIGWPILIFYILNNIIRTEIEYETDAYIIVGGCIIWIVNLYMVLTI